MNYQGVIVEESLADKTILQKVRILSTEVEPVTEKHQTPWLDKWTLHTVEVLEDLAQTIAETISRTLDYTHSTSWYADFKNATHHYIIFKNKIFLVDRQSKTQYDEAKRYGLSLGIPEHQVDFHPEVEERKR